MRSLESRLDEDLTFSSFGIAGLMRTTFLGIILLALLGVPMRGQTVAPSADKSLPAFHAKVPVVLVDIIVADNHGNPVSSLTKTDFQVLEEGKPGGLSPIRSSNSRKARVKVAVRFCPVPDRNPGPHRAEFS